MSVPGADTLVLVGLTDPDGVVSARRLAREAGAALGLDEQDQTRLATAVSELARNAHRYARGGRMELALAAPDGDRLVCRVSDDGPGIPDLDAVLGRGLGGRADAGHGLSGVQRLIDGFTIESTPSGTTVTVDKQLPPRDGVDATALRAVLSQRTDADVRDELERQNRELLTALTALQSRQDELLTLNRELDDTNRGVVALHHELAQQAERDRTISRLLQRSLMPDRLAETEGITIRGSHRSAGEHSLVGGDFYDVIDISDAEVWLVIGDVAGHGVETAAKANELRQSLRVYAREGYAPEDALDRLNALVLADDLVDLATVCLVAMDVRAGRMKVLLAGHPAPVLMVPGEAPELLDAGHGALLGVPGSRWEGAERPLPAGARIVLYTDGLVERPGETLDAGFARLLDAVGTLPDFGATAIVELFDVLPPGVALRDDVAILLADVAA